MIRNQPVQWFDGTDSVAFNGSIVSGWTDKSGNNRHATSVNASLTYNGSERGVVFSGSGYMIGTDTNSLYKNTPYAIFIVEKKNTISTLTPIYGMAATGSVADTSLFCGYIDNTTARFSQLTTGVSYANAGLATNTTRLWVFRHPQTGSRTLRLNGTVVASLADMTRINSTFPVTVGYYSGGDVQYTYNGTIYEIVGYHDDLPDSQVQQMEGYLAWKWGLKASLPTTHPYSLTNPNAPIISRRPVVWHDGSEKTTMTFSGTNVTAWPDKSGNLRNSTTGTSVITYSDAERGVVFNGTGGTTGYLLTANSTTLYKNTAYTIFIVEKKNTTAGNYVYGMAGPSGTNALLHIGYRNDTTFTFDQWANTINGTVASGLIRRLWTCRLPASGTNRILSLNGTVINTRADISQMTGTNSVTVGAIVPDGGISLYNGTIYEIIGYHGDLTDAEVQQNEGYLAWKWGLQASLPTTHPYYSVNSNVYNPIIMFRPVHWVDAYYSTNLVFSSGSNVSTWIDRSGNNRNGAKTGTAVVAYDSVERGVYFNSSNLPAGPAGYFAVSNSADLYKNTPYTIFVVEKKNPYFSNFNLFYSMLATSINSNEGLQLGYRNSTTVTFAQWGNDFNYASNNLNTSVKRLWTFENPESPLSSVMRFNGSTVATHSNNTKMTGTNPVTIGSAVNGPGGVFSTWNGTIYEIVGFHNSLSDQQVQLIEGSLAWKWGLENDLASNHPYKNTNPNLVTPTIDIKPLVENSTAAYYWTISNAPISVSSIQITLTDNFGITQTAVVPGQTNLYGFQGLTNGRSYSATITANNELGAAGNVAQFRTVEPGVIPSEPQSVQLSLVGSNQALIQWDHPTQSGGASRKWYIIQNSTTTLRFPARGYQTSLVTPQLSSGKHQFSVQAINDAGYGLKGWTQSLIVPNGPGYPQIYINYDGVATDFYENYTTTALNSPTYTASGMFGQGLTLNGTNQYLTMNGANITWSQFTFSGWVNANSTNNWSRLFDFGNSTDSYFFLSPNSGLTTYRFGIKAPGQTEQFITASIPLQNNVWSHVAVTLNGSAGYLYRNGILIGSNMSMTFTPANVNGSINYIGRSFFNGDGYLNATIDDYTFMSTALDASTIAMIYDNGTLLGRTALAISTLSTVVTNGLIYWLDPLSKTSYSGSGATMYNQGPTNVNGTLSGSYSFTAGDGLRLSNANANTTLNTAGLVSGSLTNYRTISLWYRVVSANTSYLFDGRDATANSFIWQTATPAWGTFWNSATVYINGGTGQTISTGVLTNFLAVGGWRNYTFVSASLSGNGVATFFRRGPTAEQGLDCVFGHILVYNRVITQAENTQNFNRLRGIYGI